jgi:hypothetical protein
MSDIINFLYVFMYLLIYAELVFLLAYLNPIYWLFIIFSIKLKAKAI